MKKWVIESDITMSRPLLEIGPPHQIPASNTDCGCQSWLTWAHSEQANYRWHPRDSTSQCMCQSWFQGPSLCPLNWASHPYWTQQRQQWTRMHWGGVLGRRVALRNPITDSEWFRTWSRVWLQWCMLWVYSSSLGAKPVTEGAFPLSFYSLNIEESLQSLHDFFFRPSITRLLINFRAMTGRIWIMHMKGIGKSVRILSVFFW